MAHLTKLYLLALAFILLSNQSARCITASSLHQGDKQNRWFLSCGNGYRKLGHLNCGNAGESTNMRKTPWSESLKTALSPPPAPVMRGGSPSEDIAPPPPNK
ncbi:hypothetical protein DCAR_0936127 [Daucus carota subsp. sativus]|uniref:Uncharacterized protein n=1 Tax=Daucus carota subsp. sativus TaxID=79200 RepID=A0A175YKA2_DAUCS|nr:PREDICTED: uncharacterized protein LOC108202184 [Daucus carota subsp. sativus]WOH16571.1 hypothetical protein DCAR_0936127 [Daucus carota subsp. sativus]